MRSKLLLGLALIALHLTVHARIVQFWSGAELREASDLIVFARPVAVKDLDESNGLGFQSSFRGVETTFQVSHVLKGTLESGQIVLHHYRIESESPSNGPGFVTFTPGSTNEYLLYLVKDGSGRYAPAAGQVDAYISVKSSQADAFGREVPLLDVPQSIVAHHPDAPQIKLKFVKADSEETGSQDGHGKNAVDGDPATYWHTQWQTRSPGLPHEIILKLVPPSVISGFTYLPRQDESDHGFIKDYEFYVSTDGRHFGQPVKKGRFESGREQKTETFEPVKCKFVKLRAISEINDLPWTSAAEIGVVLSGDNPGGALPGVAQARFEYEVTNGQITITSRFPDHKSVVIIPDTIDGLPVTSLGSYAFGNDWQLIRVTIPDSVTNIECYAFDGCSSLTNIVIPRTVTGIGFNRYYNTTNDSFGRCKSLKAITVDANNPAYCSLDGVLFNKDRTRLIQFPAGRTGSYTVPAGVTCIGNRAFEGCGKLTSVRIPDTVTSIGDEVFSGCEQLDDINIPGSVTAIGIRIFLGDQHLDRFVFPKSVTNLGSQAPPLLLLD